MLWPVIHATEEDVKHTTFAGYGAHPHLEEAHLREWRHARWGFPILMLGFFLQALGTILG